MSSSARRWMVTSVPVVVLRDLPDEALSLTEAAERLLNLGCGGLRELAGLRWPSVVAHEAHQRCQRLGVGLVMRLRINANAWPVGVDARGDEPLGGSLVAEQVEDARRRGVRLHAERVLDPAGQLRLVVELLERAAARDEAVTHRAANEIPGIPGHARRDNEQFTAQRPKPFGASPLVRSVAR